MRPRDASLHASGVAPAPAHGADGVFECLLCMEALKNADEAYMWTCCNRRTHLACTQQWWASQEENGLRGGQRSCPVCETPRRAGESAEAYLHRTLRLESRGGARPEVIPRSCSNSKAVENLAVTAVFVIANAMYGVPTALAPGGVIEKLQAVLLLNAALSVGVGLYRSDRFGLARSFFAPRDGESRRVFGKRHHERAMHLAFAAACVFAWWLDEAVFSGFVRAFHAVGRCADPDLIANAWRNEGRIQIHANPRESMLARDRGGEMRVVAGTLVVLVCSRLLRNAWGSFCRKGGRGELS